LNHNEREERDSDHRQEDWSDAFSPVRNVYRWNLGDRTAKCGTHCGCHRELLAGCRVDERDPGPGKHANKRAKSEPQSRSLIVDSGCLTAGTQRKPSCRITATPITCGLRQLKVSREDTASAPGSTSRLLRHLKVSQKAGGGSPFPARQETVWFRGLLCGVNPFWQGVSGNHRRLAERPNQSKPSDRSAEGRGKFGATARLDCCATRRSELAWDQRSRTFSGARFGTTTNREGIRLQLSRHLHQNRRQSKTGSCRITY